jgi:hypothetical protein
MPNQDSISGKSVQSNKEKTNVKFIPTDSKWKEVDRLLNVRLICF